MDTQIYIQIEIESLQPQVPVLGYFHRDTQRLNIPRFCEPEFTLVRFVIDFPSYILNSFLILQEQHC